MKGWKKKLLYYVSNFRLKQRQACEIASGNLKAAQAQMKRWFDREAKNREFKPGDKVLVLLNPGFSLQARNCGPHLVKQKVGGQDYLVATPDCRCRTRLCHINMLKT